MHYTGEGFGKRAHICIAKHHLEQVPVVQAPLVVLVILAEDLLVLFLHPQPTQSAPSKEDPLPHSTNATLSSSMWPVLTWRNLTDLDEWESRCSAGVCSSGEYSQTGGLGHKMGCMKSAAGFSTSRFGV